MRTTLARCSSIGLPVMRRLKPTGRAVRPTNGPTFEAFRIHRITEKAQASPGTEVPGYVQSSVETDETRLPPPQADRRAAPAVPARGQLKVASQPLARESILGRPWAALRAAPTNTD